MHAYMRSIGLSDDRIKEYDVDRLCDTVYDDYDHMESVRSEEKKVTYMELSRELGKGIGLKVIGLQDASGFHRTSYFPYVRTGAVGSEGSVGIQKKTGGDSFIGVCNDGRVAAPLIFSLQNPGLYLRGRKEDPKSQARVTTTFAGLATWGRILLPAKTREERATETISEWERDRINTVELAKTGDPKALQDITFQNLDLYAMVQARMADGEDVLSIVDTYFIPYGMESDQYHILANIDRVVLCHNNVTRESVWKLDLVCNGLSFTACVNERDVEGYPSAGMRFKGDIWLQGRLNFRMPAADMN